MSERDVPASGEPALLAEAALWRERLAAGDDARLRGQFDRWIARSPAHAAAFADSEAALRIVKQAADEPVMLGLRQQTLARLALRERRWGWRPALAAGLACLLVASGALLTRHLAGGAGAGPASTQAVQTTLYSTGAGEVTSIDLADGSRVTLNAGSRLRISFSDAERRLVLEGGQAFFDVARDADRPFIVVAAGRAVIAHGTQFDVRLGDGRLRVALLEGAVSVGRETGAGHEAGGAHDAVRLRPNDVLTATGNAVAIDHQDNVQMLAAWREGLLIFRDDALAQAVQEMNRYGTTRIVVADDRIAGLRISGAFRIGETTAFVDALEATFPVSATSASDGRIVLQRK